MNDKRYLEVCVASVESAISAQQGGADRVELCDNLSEGGTTPSLAMIEQVRKKIEIGLYVMIRPRGGDFLYTDNEFEIIKADIIHAKNAHADGVVFGLLNSDGSIDIKRVKELVEIASPMDTTFHRAFDMTKNPFLALEAVIETGCRRILTAGCANKAEDGWALIAKLQQQARGRIKLMAGSGINEHNVKELILKTNVNEVHLSGKIIVDGRMKYRNHEIQMGSLSKSNEYEYIVTDSEKIGAIRKILNELEN